MKRGSLLIVFMMAMVLAGTSLAATAKHPGSAAGGMKISGTVVSSTSSQLVLSSKVKGKAEEETFVLNPDTKTMGTLAAGERAVVRYKNEGGQKIATMIRVHKLMAAKSK